MLHKAKICPKLILPYNKYNTDKAAVVRFYLKQMFQHLPERPFCLQDTVLSSKLDFHSSLASMFRLLMIETQTPTHDLQAD